MSYHPFPLKARKRAYPRFSGKLSQAGMRQTWAFSLWQGVMESRGYLWVQPCAPIDGGAQQAGQTAEGW